jgi:hypothetical protein
MLARLLPLAASPTPAPPLAPAEIDPDRVTPGLLGLIFFVALAVAVYLLWRSMNTQLKRVDFPEESSTGGSGPAGPPASEAPSSEAPPSGTPA